jgi:hypothetical protein
MKDDDKGTYFQQADWLQYWSTAMLDWQRAYTWAMDGFAQRAEQMSGMRGGPALTPDDFMRMWSRMMENWTGGMNAMSPGMMGAMASSMGPRSPGTGGPGTHEQQQISGCATQAYFASVSNLLRWWMRVAQAWGEYARSAGARSTGAAVDGTALGVLADDTRAQLRKIVEISLEESVLLQRQMEQLADQIRNVVDGLGPDAQARRWARAKE